MVELQAITYIAQVIGVAGTLAAFVGVRSYINSNKRAQETRERELQTRQAQMFYSIHQATLQGEWVDSVTRVNKLKLKNLDDYERLVNNKADWRAFSIVAQYLEGIGVLVKENYLDVRLVAQFISGFVLWFWDSFGKMILSVRKANNFPRWMIEAEYLAKRIEDYGKSNSELKIVPSTLITDSQ